MDLFGISSYVTGVGRGTSLKTSISSDRRNAHRNNVEEHYILSNEPRRRRTNAYLARSSLT